MSMGYGGIYGTPKILDTGVGGYTAAPQDFAMPAMLQQVPAGSAKPKFFGKGGTGWDILGIVGDAFQAANGGKGTYLPAMLDMQQQVEAEKKWQAELAARAAAKDPYRFQNKAGDVYQVGPDGKPALLYTDTTPDIVPVQGSGVYAMDRHSGQQFGAPASGGLVHANKPEDIANLPAGAQFIAPDGTIRTKAGGPQVAPAGGFR